MKTIETLVDKLESHQLKGNQQKDRQNNYGVAVASSAEASSNVASQAAEDGNICVDPEPGSSEKNIVSINFRRLAAAGIFPPDQTATSVRDEYRRIKRPLLSNAFGKSAVLVDHGNLIVVTSALPGEGKTFTAINLALSISLERDHTVLLVDADVAKSDVTRLFGLENNQGLTDVLIDKTLSVGDVLIRTDVPNLSLIPSGRSHPGLAELLTSNRMKQIVAEIGERYTDRVIIFDAPPLLATSEAQMLADLSGQIAFVVRAGNTSQYAVKEAVSTLDQAKAIGLILNQTQHLFGSNYHGGYYGYKSQ